MNHLTISIRSPTRFRHYNLQMQKLAHMIIARGRERLPGLITITSCDPIEAYTSVDERAHVILTFPVLIVVRTMIACLLSQL